MSLYTLDQPVATNKLGVSAPILKQNTNAADTYFGVDHISFSAASNNGLHKQVTTLSSSPVPTISGSQAIIYGYWDGMSASPATAQGVLQYTIGNNSGVATPLTTIQSPNAGTTLNSGGTINVMDFTNLSLAVFSVYGIGSSGTGLGFFSTGIFTSTPPGIGSFRLNNIQGTSNIFLTFTNNILQIHNDTGTSFSSSYFWTLSFQRIVGP